MLINGNPCELWYSIKVDPGLSLIWTELPAGFISTLDRTETCDKWRCSLTIKGSSDEIYPLHDVIKDSIKTNSALTLTTIDGECICGSSFQSGVYTGKCEKLGAVKRANLEQFTFMMDFLVFSKPSRSTVTPDINLLPIPLAYTNTGDLQTTSFEPVYPSAYDNISTGAESGTWSFSTPSIPEDRAAAIMLDITENIRGRSFKIPSSWSELKPFGKDWTDTTYAFVRSVSETVRKLNNHVIKLELVKDVN